MVLTKAVEIYLCTVSKKCEISVNWKVVIDFFLTNIYTNLRNGFNP